MTETKDSAELCPVESQSNNGDFNLGSFLTSIDIDDRKAVQDVNETPAMVDPIKMKPKKMDNVKQKGRTKSDQQPPASSCEYVVVTNQVGETSTAKIDHLVDVDDLISQLNTQPFLPTSTTDGVEIRLMPLDCLYLFEESSINQSTSFVDDQDDINNQMLIPIDTQMMQPGNTVLLPIVPTLLPNGKIEMRVAGNPIPISRLNSKTVQEERGHERQEHDDDDDKGVDVEVEEDDLNRNMIEHSRTAIDLLGSSRYKPRGSKRLWNCEYCDYSNTQRYLLVRHMKSHSEDRPFQCHLCDHRFKTNSSLNNHINTHTGKKPFPCGQCEMAFTTSGELIRHQRYKHTLEKPHQCPDCDYATVELSKLKRHIRSHTGERPYKCTMCNYMASDQYKMKRHIRSHTGEKPYECEICGVRFSQSNSMKTHRLNHNPEQEKPMFPCEFCPVSCGRKTDLRMHVEKQHRQGSPIGCEKCGATFTDRYSYRLHWKSHQGQKCFRCPHCPYQSTGQRHLEQHMMVHSDVKPFECSEPGCARRFRQLAQLKRHHNIRHDPYYELRSGEKTHICPIVDCQRGFRHMGNLKRHLQWHSCKDGVEQNYEGEVDQREQTNGRVDRIKNASSSPSSSSATTGKRPRGRPMKRRFRPEDLGMTDFRRRGRPRKCNLPNDDDFGRLPNVKNNRLTAFKAEQSMSFDDQLEQNFGFEDQQQEEKPTVDEPIDVEGDEQKQASSVEYPEDRQGFPLLVSEATEEPFVF